MSVLRTGAETANEILATVSKEFKDKHQRTIELANRAQMMGAMSEAQMQTLKEMTGGDTVDTRESFVEQKIAAGLGQEMANDIVGAVKREFKDKEKQIEELINRAQMMGVLSDGDMKTLAEQGDEGGGKAGGGDHVARAEQRLAKLMQDKKKLVRDKLAAVLGAGDVDNMIAQIEQQCEGLPALALPALPPTPLIACMWGQSAPLQHCVCYNSGHPPIHTHVQQPQEPQPLGPSHSLVPCDHSRARCRCNL